MRCGLISRDSGRHCILWCQPKHKLLRKSAQTVGYSLRQNNLLLVYRADFSWYFEESQHGGENNLEYPTSCITMHANLALCAQICRFGSGFWALSVSEWPKVFPPSELKTSNMYCSLTVRYLQIFWWVLLRQFYLVQRAFTTRRIYCLCWGMSDLNLLLAHPTVVPPWDWRTTFSGTELGTYPSK